MVKNLLGIDDSDEERFGKLPENEMREMVCKNMAFKIYVML